MRQNGSGFFSNAAAALALLLAGLWGGVSGCGDQQATPKAPRPGQGAEIHGAGGQGGGTGLPPLEEVEPADEDIEVPPAP